MRRFATFVDALNRRLAMAIRWLALVMVLVQFAIVIVRYAFGYNSIAAQESVLYMHATLFMLGAGYTLLVDKHVRVDIFYARLSPRAQKRIEVFGHVFLLIPAMVALVYWSWSGVVRAWEIWEGPLSVGGVKAVYWLRSLIPIFCVLLLLQALAHLTRLALAEAPQEAERP